MILQDYLPIAVLLVLSTVLAFIVIILGHSFGPRRTTPRMQEPYESGIRGIGSGMRRMPVRFYRIAMLFILFDIEVMFMLPWAVAFRQLELFGFVQMAIFIAVVMVGDFWAWRKGALEWESSDAVRQATRQIRK